mmetsp:Transcript_7106/g.43991  ORF Transcript_7106/g.43991 Transcript_7106/m.43991 type:complete len:229 (+) Transcript_7106:2978-3664(+)
MRGRPSRRVVLHPARADLVVSAVAWGRRGSKDALVLRDPACERSRTLQAIAGLGFLAHHVQHGIDEFCAFGVVSLGPVVSGSGLSKDEIVGTEDLSKRAGTHGVHGSGFQVHEDGSGDVPSTGGFVEVHVDPFELQVAVSMVGSDGIDAVFVAADLPELGPDLVPTLARLDVHDLAHGCRLRLRRADDEERKMTSTKVSRSFALPPASGARARLGPRDVLVVACVGRR